MDGRTDDSLKQTYIGLQTMIKAKHKQKLN